MIEKVKNVLGDFHVSHCDVKRKNYKTTYNFDTFITVLYLECLHILCIEYCYRFDNYYFSVAPM